MDYLIEHGIGYMEAKRMRREKVVKIILIVAGITIFMLALGIVGSGDLEILTK